MVRKRKGKYKWDEWFSKTKFRLRKGKDYTCSTSTMIQQVRNTACEKRLGVSVSEGTDLIIVTVHHD